MRLVQARGAGSVAWYRSPPRSTIEIGLNGPPATLAKPRAVPGSWTEPPNPVMKLSSRLAVTRLLGASNQSLTHRTTSTAYAPSSSLMSSTIRRSSVPFDVQCIAFPLVARGRAYASIMVLTVVPPPGASMS